MAMCSTPRPCMAIIREKRNQTFDLVNQKGTEMVAKAAREAGVKHFVHMSAIGAQDNGASGLKGGIDEQGSAVARPAERPGQAPAPGSSGADFFGGNP